MPKAKVGDIQMYYQLQGEGDPVVLIMGLGADHMGWFLQIPVLVQAGFRVLVFDNRGVGRTDKPEGEYSTELFARDTAGLLDAVGIERAHVVGLSMGGMIAQKFALLFPERVRKLALCATYARIRPDVHDAASRALLGAPAGAAAGETPAQLLDQMDITRLWMGDPDPKRMLGKVLPLLFTPAFIDQARPMIEGFLGGSGGEMVKSFAPPLEAFMRQARACMAHDTVDELHKIRAETLVLVGKEDVLTPMAYSEELAREIPGAHMTVVDACGHGFNFERMAEFNDALIAFLKR